MLKRSVLSSLICLAGALVLRAQVAPQEPRLTVGGYGEAAFSANFYSDNVYRYSSASAHAGERHARVDVPHAVIYLGYDFGRGWTMQTEIEFEHTGTGAAVEKEFEEGRPRSRRAARSNSSSSGSRSPSRPR